jgi:hypothetical protein
MQNIPITKSFNTKDIDRLREEWRSRYTPGANVSPSESVWPREPGEYTLGDVVPPEVEQRFRRESKALLGHLHSAWRITRKR